MMTQGSLPLVSVIIPIYHGENYVQEAVRSILNQTYPHIELLLIDDGSPDKSGELCDEIASSDARIQVFHIPHQGVAAARNVGLDHAKGDYICFFDVDDHMYGDMIRLMVSAMEKEKADLAICNVFDEKASGLGGLLGWHIKDKNLSSETIRHRLLLGLDPQVWRKIYHASLWENLRFSEESHYEDLHINTELVLRAKKLIATDQVLYNNNHYNEQRIGLTDKPQRMVHELDAWLHAFTLAKQDKQLAIYKEYYNWQGIRSWLRCYDMLPHTLFDENDFAYTALFSSATLPITNRLVKHSANHVLWYYLATLEVLRLSVSILKKNELEYTEELRHMFQAAIQVLCINKVCKQVSEKKEKEIRTLIKEGRSYKKHLTIAQQLMLTLLEEEPAGIIEFKGKQYIKKGIPQND